MIPQLCTGRPHKVVCDSLTSPYASRSMRTLIGPNICETQVPTAKDPLLHKMQRSRGRDSHRVLKELPLWDIPLLTATISTKTIECYIYSIVDCPVTIPVVPIDSTFIKGIEERARKKFPSK